MHSKIIEVSKHPLKEDERVEESYFYDGFVGWIADYVDCVRDEETRKAIQESFVEGMGLISGKDGFTIPKGYRDAFIDKRIEELRNIIASASTVNFWKTKVQIKAAIGDDVGLYIYKPGYGTVSYIQFIDECEEEVPYYFGAIIDYHW